LELARGLDWSGLLRPGDVIEHGTSGIMVPVIKPDALRERIKTAHGEAAK
jgi:hypothetical protein